MTLIIFSLRTLNIELFSAKHWMVIISAKSDDVCLMLPSQHWVGYAGSVRIQGLYLSLVIKKDCTRHNELELFSDSKMWNVLHTYSCMIRVKMALRYMHVSLIRNSTLIC